uniref:hypothetical protein n=1 Tax=Pseudomonas sp. RW407 TaxID=2202894 RepID=UPI0011B6F0A5|nr:hypothetical protein [Pseudomonas sp. RW407]
MKLRERAVTPVAEHWLRPLGLFGVLIGLVALLAAMLICTEVLLPNYIRLWRQAPIVETVYPTFFIVSGLAIGPMMLVAGVHTLLYRKPLTSQSPTWFKIAGHLLGVGIILLLVVGPALAIGTTIALKYMDYRACSQLRVSGSGWQVFWVNNDNYCFKPDSYIEDSWPCRNMDGKTYCLRADGL